MNEWKIVDQPRKYGSFSVAFADILHQRDNQHQPSQLNIRER